MWREEEREGERGDMLMGGFVLWVGEGRERESERIGRRSVVCLSGVWWGGGGGVCAWRRKTGGIGESWVSTWPRDDAEGRKEKIARETRRGAVGGGGGGCCGRPGTAENYVMLMLVLTCVTSRSTNCRDQIRSACTSHPRRERERIRRGPARPPMHGTAHRRFDRTLAWCLRGTIAVLYLGMQAMQAAVPTRVPMPDQQQSMGHCNLSVDAHCLRFLGSC